MITAIQPIDIKPILDSYENLKKQMVWTRYQHKGSQTGLQYKPGQDPWTSAVGRGHSDELSYTSLNPFFHNTIFEKIITEFRLARTRLMWVGPYACYSMHADTTARIHVPLITNSQCYFVFKEGRIEHMPVGQVYRVDTTKTHTFMNCSDQHRLHLVGVVEPL